jgi:putative MATE family efflux protein
MVAHALYNVVDRIFIGQAVGPQGLAGATVAFPFMMVLMAFAMLTGYGAAALVSLRLGQQRRDLAEHVLGNATVLMVVVSAALTFFGLTWLDPLLVLFGASENILPYARDYLEIIAWGTIFQTLSFGLNSVIRGEGNPRVAMLSMLIGAVLNTILDPILLFGFGMGMRGAAVATVFSQAVSAAWVVAYFVSGKSLLRLVPANLRLRWSVCREIMAVGSPSFALHLASSLLNTVLNNQLRIHGGDLAISAMGIVYAVVLFIAMPIQGINQGAQPIIGYNYGARRFDRVVKALRLAVAATTLIAVAGFLMAMVLPHQIVRLFEDRNQQLVELGARALRISLSMLPIIGLQVIGANYFQAVGRPRQAMFLMLNRQVLLLIPALIVLPRYFGLDGVWAALPLADLIGCLITAGFLWREMHALHRRQAQL